MRDTHYDVSWKVDPVSHGGDFLKGIQHGSIRAAHGSTILVFVVSKLIKTRCTCSLKNNMENVRKHNGLVKEA